MSVLVIKWLGLGSVENPMVMAQTVKNPLAVQETWVWSLGQEDPPPRPGERNGDPLQYFCLENPMDRGDWQAVVCGVTKSWTQCSN